MNLLNKIRWFLAVSVVFVVVLATNLIDKNNFEKVEQSVDNIYNERILAKEILLELATKFHKNELAYALNDTTYLESENARINDEITNSLQLFNRVGTTHQEQLAFNNLKKNHDRLIRYESQSQNDGVLYTSECAEIFSAINKNINDLAEEQIKEGENQKRLAANAVNSVKLFSQIEIYFLILLVLVLQFIILYKPKTTSE